jgi:oxygen-independent coproporphyrinogen-3 oxidase
MPRHSVRLTSLPPLSLYIHIPWCIKKCPYCDFNSHEFRAPKSESSRTVTFSPNAVNTETNPPAALPEAEYIDALIADLEASLPDIWGRRISTIFFGGGTPSMFSADGVDRILTAVRTRIVVQAGAEITLEANPGTFEMEKFAGFRSAGVNRLSIGIQSFNPRHLKALGRVHDADEAARAVGIATAVFDNLNLDIMYALPEQTLAEALADIDTALAFEPRHVSAYHLTLEPNTLFYRHPPPLPDDELAADMQEAIEVRLIAAGYNNYETSAFARPGSQSQHNLNYWQFGDYLGIGAGAASKLSFHNRIQRSLRQKQPKAYMDSALKASPSANTALMEAHDVAAGDLPFEFMMNHLRLADGFALEAFTRLTGQSVVTIQAPLAQAQAQGLIERTHSHVKPTPRGKRMLNDLLGLFMSFPACAAAPESRLPAAGG